MMERLDQQLMRTEEKSKKLAKLCMLRSEHEKGACRNGGKRTHDQQKQRRMEI